MRKFILLAVSVLFFANICLAQDGSDSTKNEKKHSFAITGGYGKARKKDSVIKRYSFGFNYGTGFPFGNFHMGDQSKYPISRLNGKDTGHLGGYGQSGFHFEYYFAYRVYKCISIMASLSGNDIGYNINEVNAQYIQFFAPNTTVVTSGDSYYILQYLIGPDAELRIGKYFKIEAKALIGLMSANYPTLSYSGLPNGLPTALYSFPQGSGFSYNLGTGIKYIAAEGPVAVHVDVAYAGSTVNFSSYSMALYTPPTNNPATSNNYISSAVYNTPKSLSVSMFQFTLGLSVEL
ncbi:MAG TPA: hypothetical protein VK809_09655 [Bacteroidia bacterium]|jgi:hypothetical protein|nr:hypothetical protein [Bacteroidia bacterium]